MSEELPVALRLATYCRRRSEGSARGTERAHWRRRDRHGWDLGKSAWGRNGPKQGSDDYDEE